MCGNRIVTGAGDISDGPVGFCGQSELLLSVFLNDHLPYFNIQCALQTKALEKSRNEICDLSQHHIPNPNADRVKE